MPSNLTMPSNSTTLFPSTTNQTTLSPFPSAITQAPVYTTTSFYPYVTRQPPQQMFNGQTQIRGLLTLFICFLCFIDKPKF